MDFKVKNDMILRPGRFRGDPRLALSLFRGQWAVYPFHSGLLSYRALVYQQKKSALAFPISLQPLATAKALPVRGNRSFFVRQKAFQTPKSCV